MLGHSSLFRIATLPFLTSLGFLCLLPLQGLAQSTESTGANSVIVQAKFGGQIFGFDIDQNGTEGILSEAQILANGNVLAAVETFNQKTGKILTVMAKTETQDDFVTLGVVGTSVGLVEHEHVISLLDVQRTFGTINPLSSNKSYRQVDAADWKHASAQPGKPEPGNH